MAVQLSSTFGVSGFDGSRWWICVEVVRKKEEFELFGILIHFSLLFR